MLLAVEVRTKVFVGDHDVALGQNLHAPGIPGSPGTLRLGPYRNRGLLWPVHLGVKPLCGRRNRSDEMHSNGVISPGAEDVLPELFALLPECDLICFSANRSFSATIGPLRQLTKILEH